MFSIVSVRHFVCREGTHVTITHDTLDLTVQDSLSLSVSLSVSLFVSLSLWGSAPPLYNALPPATGIWWPRLITCLNLLTQGPHCTDPPTGGSLRTVGKEVKRFLLECFIVAVSPEVWDKVMILHVSVILFTGRGSAYRNGGSASRECLHQGG